MQFKSEQAYIKVLLQESIAEAIHVPYKLQEVSAAGEFGKK